MKPKHETSELRSIIETAYAALADVDVITARMIAVETLKRLDPHSVLNPLIAAGFIEGATQIAREFCRQHTPPMDPQAPQTSLDLGEWASRLQDRYGVSRNDQDVYAKAASLSDDEIDNLIGLHERLSDAHRMHAQVLRRFKASRRNAA